MTRPPVTLALLSTPFALSVPMIVHGAPATGFIDAATATLTVRNYFFSRDFSDIVGSNRQSMAQEWAQGFILDVKSGFTPGAIGFGLDVQGLLGVRFDSSPDRVNTGLLPLHDNGKAAGEYSRLGAALKARYQNTEVRVGDLQPNLPILMFSDVRLLPPSWQGVSVHSQEITGLTLQGGRLHSSHLRNEGGDERIQAVLGHMPQRQVSSDGFNYAGGEYVFNDSLTSASTWVGQLQDIYRQGFLGFRHRQPLGDWSIGLNVGYFNAHEEGERLLGNIDNQALFTMLSLKHGGHTLSIGYQAMYGDSPFPRVFSNISPLGNETPTYEFAWTDERSWQVRHEYDFAALGLPGLSSSLRWITGNNAQTGKGYEGREHERDIDLGYVVQSGALQGLGIRVRNAMARSNYRSDIDENRLIITYTWKLL